MLLVAGWLAWNRIHVQPLQRKLEGRKVTVSTDGWEARYLGLGSFDETLMLFGGIADPERTGIHDAEIEGIDVSRAQPLLARYPDLFRFTSPGAAQARPMLEQHPVVSANADVQRTLQLALRRHEEALASNGERVCVTVRGRHLELESLRLLDDGRDVTGELPPEVRGSDVVFAETATIVECRPVLGAAGEREG